MFFLFNFWQFKDSCRFKNIFPESMLFAITFEGEKHFRIYFFQIFLAPHLMDFTGNLYPGIYLQL